MKWKFDTEKLTALIACQRQIFAEACTFVKPGGKIVYATCSVLPQENTQQTSFFEKEHGLIRVDNPFISFPREGEMDGFFGQIFALSDKK
jgi:16S rRNA (cytosine967-C5)-methyltransferase